MKALQTLGVTGAGTIGAGIAQGCVAAGPPGRKSGRGFHAYERGNKVCVLVESRNNPPFRREN